MLWITLRSMLSIMSINKRMFLLFYFDSLLLFFENFTYFTLIFGYFTVLLDIIIIFSFL